jgi:N-acetylmuramoyl-L-alanine amidase
MYDIKWIGSPFKESRRGIKPFVIGDHVSQGTLGSMDAWFSDPSNPGSSSHFGVGLDGTIHQYVKIEEAAWTQGLAPDAIQYATAPVVKDMNCNPNLYCVSIEREGYYVKNEDGTEEGNLGWLDGSAIPEAQWNALCWLHRYIMDYVKNNMGQVMGLGNYNVIGHFQIDPRRKPLCPGLGYPWAKLYAELAIAEKMTLQDYEMRLQFQQSGYMTVANAVKVKGRVEDLYGKLSDSKNPYYKPALEKLSMIYKLMDENNLLDNK